MRSEARRVGSDARRVSSDVRDVELRVRYAETDRMGVAWHGNYLTWFEVGRTTWLRAAGPGRSYRALEEKGYLLPVVEVASRYHSPARYDDLLVVRTRLAEASRIRMAFDYEVIRREDGRLLAEGRTVHVVTGPEGRPRRLPEELLAWIVGEPAVQAAPAEDGR